MAARDAAAVKRRTDSGKTVDKVCVFAYSDREISFHSKSEMTDRIKEKA